MRLFSGLLTAIALMTITMNVNAQSSTQTEKQLDREIKVRARIDYLLFLPENYDKSDQKWPLMLFLHGAGESGKDLAKVKVHGPPKIVEARKDFPFIVVSPQSPGRGWDVNVLNALIDEVVEKYRVDKDRIYLTGLSMGGYGTWALAVAFPGRFAAIAPICGGGNPVEASKLKDMPIWAFHGAKDSVVPLQRSQEMVSAIERAGNKDVKLTVYPEADHDSWTVTYNTQELYDWLLEHKRTDRKQLRERG
jgi:predicted peptidase